MTSSVMIPSAKNASAASLASWVACENTDMYWPGLPTALLGSPAPPVTVGKAPKLSDPPVTKSGASFFMAP
jgi:hypothetical protein